MYKITFEIKYPGAQVKDYGPIQAVAFAGQA
jgi:hypothetical protein